MVEFLRARNVFGRRRAEELVRNVELKEMKGIVKIEGEAVIVKEQWLAKVAHSRKLSAAVEKALQSLIVMRAEGEVPSYCCYHHVLVLTFMCSPTTR